MLHSRGYSTKRRSQRQRLQGERRLLLFQKRQVRTVASILHFFHRNETQGGRINGVTLAGRRLWVGKQMAKMGVTSCCVHFSALHIVRSIHTLGEQIFRNRFAKR